MKSLKFDLLPLVEQALTVRKALWERETTVRLFDGTADGSDEFFIDRLGPCVLMHVLVDEGSDLSNLRPGIEQAAQRLLSATQSKAVYLRVHAKQARESADRAAELLCGQACPEFCVEEQGMRYLVRPEQAVNAGVFVDTREVRKLLRTSCAGQQVLNLFCYTGLLGLAALCSGAEVVTQVDVSKSILQWAGENRALNEGSAHGTMRLICDDAVVFLEKESRRHERGKQGYHTVIIDPPSFGSGPKRSFSLQRNMPILLSGGMKVLEPGGRLFAMCNLRALSSADLYDMLQQAAASLGRRVQNWQTLESPAPDFRTPPTQASSMRGILAWLT
ncbi:MAG: class I SAM-dependent methyltransferase [Oligoflexia bacterium]|nr:class I SAM-dependent methyltransferase [Oligoflexia bacterium]